MKTGWNRERESEREREKRKKEREQTELTNEHGGRRDERS